MGLYHSTDVDGITLLNPDRAQMRALLKSLEDPDIQECDHPDVSLTENESGYSISVYPGGIMTLDNFDAPDVPPRYLKVKDLDDCLKIWTYLATGQLNRVLSLPWADSMNS